MPAPFYAGGAKGRQKKHQLSLILADRHKRKESHRSVSTGGEDSLTVFLGLWDRAMWHYVLGSGSPPLRVMIHKYTLASIPSLIGSTWASAYTWLTMPPAWLLLGPHKRPGAAPAPLRFGSAQLP